MTENLFGDKPELNQYFTPEWAACRLVEQYFPDLGSSDLVVEPSCGLGAFLKAIPAHVPAVGVEIDEDLAKQAEQLTGRRVICGDFCTTKLPDNVTAIIGNPPFEMATVKPFLNRAYELLPDLGRLGFILPAYAFQIHRTVLSWSSRWGLRTDMIPRTLFPKLTEPLVFAIFTRGRSHEMVGLSLYREMGELDGLRADVKRLLVDGRPRRGVWNALVTEELQRLGGEATLEELYRAIEPHRPTPNAWWKEKVRQILQLHHHSVSVGRWKLKAVEQ